MSCDVTESDQLQPGGGCGYKRGKIVGTSIFVCTYVSSFSQRFCGAVLEQLSLGQWTPKTQAAALTALRIAAREKEGVTRLR